MKALIGTQTPPAALIDPMITTIPCCKTMNTVFQRRRGTETDVTGKIIDVRICRLYVAGLHRQHFLFADRPNAFSRRATTLINSAGLLLPML